jgi:hypothetical protein
MENSTAYEMLNDTIKQQSSKSMDMRYYWLQERDRQNKIYVYWLPGKDNLGDYHTKHHSSQHHKDMRPIKLLKSFICASVVNHDITKVMGQ